MRNWKTLLVVLGALIVYPHMVGAELQTMILDTYSDCILLDDVTTIVSDLVPGETYTVSVSNSGISGTPMQGAFFMYQETYGSAHFRYVDAGQSFVFQPIDNYWQLAPLYVD